MICRALPMMLLALVLFSPASKAAEPAKLPKVVLIGDSIRLGYAPLVAKRLAGPAGKIRFPLAGAHL